MIKRFIILMLMLIAGSCSADVILGSISDGYTYSSFDANNVVISFGSVAPSGILEFEWLFASGDATDTSGNSNDGTIIGMVNVPLTNGLASHFDMANATNSMSATMGNGVESICWWGNSNGTWRYYESIGGTQRVNNATEAYTASDWFTTNGTAFNFGGSAFDIAQARGYNTVIANEVGATNRTELGSNLGILAPFLASNTNLLDHLVFGSTHNNVYQDESKNHFTIDSTASPSLSGSTNEGWGVFDGSTTYYTAGGSEYVHLSTQFSFAVWIRLADSPGAEGIIGEYSIGVGERSWIVYRSATEILFQTSGSSPGAVKPPLGEWMHVAGIYDLSGNDESILYTNGVVDSIDSHVNPLLTNALPFMVGNYWTGGTYVFTGDIDEPMIFDNILPSNKIYELWNTTKGTHQNP